MNRRRYLALVGASVGLPGCSGGEPTDTPTPEPTTTDTPTAAATSTPTPTETEATTESETATETDTPTEATATEAERQLTRAREYLVESVETYLSFAPANTEGLLGVTAASTDFSSGAVFEASIEALETLNAAENSADGKHAAEIDRLRSVYEFINNAAVAQDYLGDAYVELDRIMDHIDADEFDSASGAGGSMASATETADDAFGELKENSDADDMNAIEPRTPEDFTDKVGQFDSELTALGQIDNALPDLIPGLEGFTGSMDEFESGSTGTFPTERFEDAAQELEGCPRPNSMASFVGTLTCLAENRAEVCELMNDAVAARQDGNDNTANRYHEDAEETLKECF